jgi:hypothetical protein
MGIFNYQNRMDATTHTGRMVSKDPVTVNAETLERELAWLSEVIDTRMRLYFGQETAYADISEVTPPDPVHENSMYAGLIKHYEMSAEERLVFMLALAPHIRPQLLDVFFVKNGNVDRGFTEFGGIKAQSHGGLLPTAETAIFMLAGEDLSKRFAYQYMFDGEHFFARHSVMKLEPAPPGEPTLSGLLSVSREIIDFVTLGHARRPTFDRDFPAKRISTPLDWDDLVLDGLVREQIEEIQAWMQHEHTIMDVWGMRKKLKPGYRALFFGPPGTGKTLTACLLGQLTGRDIYRIDLSMVVSKYIGETEKNLSRVFEQAENKNWILFFDEADALFGKRTKVEDAHDRYANQEVSYLLQRIEDFEGVIILASNFKSNMDDAFTRRFQGVIHFPMPRPDERLKLWKLAFPPTVVLEKDIDLKLIADRYEIAGGSIINVVRYCAMMALRKNGNIITLEDITEGIRREFRKEGKTV